MKKKRLYLYLVQPKVPVHGYEIYRKFVIVAESPKAAAARHPSYTEGGGRTHAEWWLREADDHRAVWVWSPAEVKAKCLGTAARGLKAGQIICSDYIEG
jgi:hypothetical protein